MKPHVKLYMASFGFGEQDFIPCEVCGAKAVDIHHIDARGMGATDQKNKIENLMALCRMCHTKYGDVKNLIDWLKHLHQMAMKKFGLI